MKSVRTKLSAWLAPIAIMLSVASLTLAQTDSDSTMGDRLEQLISQRRSQLDQRLKNLRVAQESFGENHPSSERVRLQIADTEKEIETLSERETLLNISEEDLRIVILRLTLRVDHLQNEVNSLKQRIPRRTIGARTLGRTPGRVGTVTQAFRRQADTPSIGCYRNEFQISLR